MQIRRIRTYSELYFLFLTKEKKRFQGFTSILPPSVGMRSNIIQLGLLYSTFISQKKEGGTKRSRLLWVNTVEC